MISVPACTQYQDEGSLMMLATAIPPFRQIDVVIISE